MTDRGPADTWDAGVQNERTALAWQRTGLALFGGIVVAARLGMRQWPVVTAVALAPALALAMALLHLAARRYRQAQAAVRDEAPRPGGRLPLFAATSIALLGLAALAAVVAGIS
jgi:putative membrane protein